MKPILILAAALVGLTGLSASNATAETTAPETAPDWSLADADGVTVTLSEVSRVKPQIVLFWATWCPYCRALMPQLQSIVMEQGERVGVLAVNIREDDDPAEYLESNGLDFRLLPEGDRVAELYGVKGTPALMLVDTKRRIRFDLRKLPNMPMDSGAQQLSHRERAARLAPYWAAELRKAIDAL